MGQLQQYTDQQPSRLLGGRRSLLTSVWRQREASQQLYIYCHNVLHNFACIVHACFTLLPDPVARPCIAHHIFVCKHHSTVVGSLFCMWASVGIGGIRKKRGGVALQGDQGLGSLEKSSVLRLGRQGGSRLSASRVKWERGQAAVWRTRAVKGTDWDVKSLCRGLNGRREVGHSRADGKVAGGAPVGKGLPPRRSSNQWHEQEREWRG